MLIKITRKIHSDIDSKGLTLSHGTHQWEAIACLKSLSKELDEKLFEYLEEARGEGLAVSNKLLLHRASEIAGGPALKSFKCSSGWLHRWKARYNVGYRRGTNTSQKIPADYADQIFKVRKEIMKLRKKHMIEPSQIYNMYQTMCHFDMPQNRTNARRGGSLSGLKPHRLRRRDLLLTLLHQHPGRSCLPSSYSRREVAGLVHMSSRSWSSQAMFR